MTGAAMLRRLANWGLLCLVNCIAEYLDLEELCHALILCYGSVMLSDLDGKTLKRIITYNCEKLSDIRDTSECFYRRFRQPLLDICTAKTIHLNQFVLDPIGSIDSWRALTPRELLCNYQNSLDLISEPNQASGKWKFDIFHSINSKNCVKFNPIYPVVLISTANVHSRNKGPEGNFVVLRLPGKQRNEKGQIVYIRNFVESSTTNMMISHCNWSPNGLFLSVCDRYELGPSIMRFFRFYDKKSSLREIKNLSITLPDQVITHSNPWFDSSTAMITIEKIETCKKGFMKVKKINFSKNNSSYTTEIFNSQPIFYCKPPQYSMKWARMFIPIQNGIHYIYAGICDTENHHHDMICFNTTDKTDYFIKKFYVPGIIVELVSMPKENVLVVLFGNSKHHRVVYEPNLNCLEQKYSCPYCPVKVDSYETRAEIDSDDPDAEPDDPKDVHLCYASIYRSNKWLTTFKVMEINTKTWRSKILESTVMLPLNAFEVYECDDIGQNRMDRLAVNTVMTVSKDFVTICLTPLHNQNVNCNTYHLNRKVKGLILNKKGCGKLPAVHVSGYTTRVNQWRRHEQDLKFFLYDSAGPKERKKLKRIIVPSYNSGVNFQLKECKKRKID